MKVPTVPALRVGDARRAVARFGAAPRTVGIPLLPPDASDERWLETRRKLVTASEVAAVLGQSPYDSPFSLWWRKQDNWPAAADRDLQRMRIGRKLESVIGELWAEAHPEAALFRPGAALWGHWLHTWLAATPDYFGVFDRGDAITAEPVECKSDEGGDGWGCAGTDEIPFHHLCQLITQCMVIGADRGHLIRLAGKRVTEYTVLVENHQRLVEDIAAASASFHTSLTLGIAPDVDGHQATTQTLQTMYGHVEKDAVAYVPDELADVYEEAYATVKAWETRRDEAVNRIRELMGKANAQYGVRASSGERIVTRSHYKRQGYTVAPAEIDQIRKSKGGKSA